MNPNERFLRVNDIPSVIQSMKPNRLLGPNLVVLSLLLLCAFCSCGQPAQIILLRHAEKPRDKAAVHLSPRGQERAAALTSLLGRTSLLTSNAPITALYATKVSSHDRSQRTGETLAPLSKELSLPVMTPFRSNNYRQLAAKVLSDTTYRDKTVVICWTHTEIAELASALGVKPTPRHWKSTVFDRLWIITFPQDNAQLTDRPQHLLAGDSVH
jgi:hypothetical protein